MRDWNVISAMGTCYAPTPRFKQNTDVWIEYLIPAKPEAFSVAAMESIAATAFWVSRTHSEHEGMGASPPICSPPSRKGERSGMGSSLQTIYRAAAM